MWVRKNSSVTKFGDSDECYADMSWSEVIPDKWGCFEPVKNIETSS
jgi:hypothetical protein